MHSIQTQSEYEIIMLLKWSIKTFKIFLKILCMLIVRGLLLFCEEIFVDRQLVFLGRNHEAAQQWHGDAVHLAATPDWHKMYNTTNKGDVT